MRKLFFKVSLTNSVYTGLLFISFFVTVGYFVSSKVPFFLSQNKNNDVDFSDTLLIVEKEINVEKINPNNASEEDLRKLGFKEGFIKNILNHQKNGKVIRTKADFAKLYAYSDPFFNKIKNRIDLPDYIDYNENNKFSNFRRPEKQISLYEFDPNTCKKEDLMNFGLSSKQADVFIRYREKIKFFRTKEDLKKVFVINDSVYKILEPFIKIDESKLVINKVEINTADSMALSQIPFLPKYLIKSILNYRNSLGGFYSKNQLLEIRTMKEEIFNNICDYIEVDTSQIKKINIKYADYNELSTHPYISKDLAYRIVKFRRRQGIFFTIDELIKQGVMSAKEYHKIKFYVIAE